MARFDRSPYRVSVSGGRVVVVVTYCPEWQEYRARLSVDGRELPDSDAFADDAEDIESTAHAMAKHAQASLQPLQVLEG